ncbi:MAG: hypothetical protein LQ350_001619 [Teloschistes chrysophthalmus]|nr:MAG: hypothetical protein LQ350_001619 [Niorma chrysophthalma]
MPEIGEVARIVHYLHKHLVGKTLAVVKAQHDENVFGKVGTSAAEFEKALTGKKVVGARQQGKYFWLVMSSPPHPLFHFGMAGWWKIRNEETAYYKPSKPSEPTWPPKYWKFTLETAESPKTEHAFVDLRRFGRIRLIDCAGEEMRNVSPLKENGPDPVIDKDILTEEWLVQKLQSKHVPVKALLLDQANISGIGNWVGDELLLDAKIHPEQYSNTLTAAQMKQLHKSIHYVCSTAVELRAESDKFPETWLFKHRWGKGKKDDPQRLPNGEKIKFLTVGGRTSAIIPTIQKKTGDVKADLDGSGDENEGSDENEEAPPKKAKKAARKNKKENDEDEPETDSKPTKPAAAKSKKRAVKDDEEPDAKPAPEDEPPPSKRAKAKPNADTNGIPKAEANGAKASKSSSSKKAKGRAKVTDKASPKTNQPREQETEERSGRRRSGRVSYAGM